MRATCTVDGCEQASPREGRRCAEHRQRNNRTYLPRPDTCEIDACTNVPACRRKWPTEADRTWVCQAHNHRLINGRPMDAPMGGLQRERVVRECTRVGCSEPARRDRHGALRARCEAHKHRRQSTTCRMPGCEQPVTRQPNGNPTRRCTGHRGAHTPEHDLAIRAGQLRARARKRAEA